MEGILISFLYLCLNIAVICFVAYIILWVVTWFGFTIDGNVLKFGKIIVALLVIIAIVRWVFGLGLLHL